jgi:hypothetical protein
MARYLLNVIEHFRMWAQMKCNGVVFQCKFSLA